MASTIATAILAPGTGCCVCDRHAHAVQAAVISRLGETPSEDHMDTSCESTRSTWSPNCRQGARSSGGCSKVHCVCIEPNLTFAFHRCSTCLSSYLQATACARAETQVKG